MTRLATLACIITLGAGLPAMADSQWIRIGPNGGTASGSQNCSGSNGAGYACSGQSNYAGPKGRTATRIWQGTGTATGGERTVTTTGSAGKARTHTFRWQCNN